MKKEQDRDLLEFLEVLGNGIRFDIISLLVSGEKCVCEIYKNLNLPQNLISYHLGILRKNKLIVGQRNGKWVYYSLNMVSINKLKAYLEKIISIQNRVSKCKKCLD